jgi:hypothetical protein
MTSSDINGTIGGVTIDGDDNGTSIKAAGWVVDCVDAGNHIAKPSFCTVEEALTLWSIPGLFIASLYMIRIWEFLIMIIINLH